MRAPRPREIELHVAFAELVRRLIDPAWRFTHIPLGEYRHSATAAKLQRMGVMPGWPDFVFVGLHHQVFWLELKRPGERPSAEQHELAGHLVRSGCSYLCTDNLDDAIGALRDLGIVRARVTA